MRFVSLRTVLTLCALPVVAMFMLGFSKSPAGSGQKLRILFMGNSHTANYDVPALVKAQLESDGSGRQVYTQAVLGAHLEDIYDVPANRELVAKGDWDFVVLQGAQISSSHQYTYPQYGTIGLAQIARKAGARALYFAEWPRQGIDESQYIYDIYARDAAATGAEVVPICFTWDLALKRLPGLSLWSPDGNHSSLQGAYFASCGFYYWITHSTSDPTWIANGVDPVLAKFYRNIARTVDQKYWSR